jgi:hypothetical protein
MLEFLRDRYYELYDLPNFYLGIENETYCHIFSILFLIFLAGLILLAIKNAREYYTLRRDRRIIQRKIERSIMGVLEEKDKNKKNLK